MVCPIILHTIIESLYDCYLNSGNISKNFALRLDADMMEAIEKWAADEFRSTNGQLQYILDQALKKTGRSPKKKSV